MNKPAVIITAITLGALIGAVAGVRQAQNRTLDSVAQSEVQRSASQETPTAPAFEFETDGPRSPSIESSQAPTVESSQAPSVGQEPASAPASAGAQVSVEVSEAEVNQLVKQAIAANADRSPILANADDFSLTIADGRIEGGARVRLADIPSDYLGEQERALLDGASRFLPGLNTQDIYIGVSGRPETLNGQVLLGDDLTLKVGRLNLPFSEVSSRLGVPIEAIEQRINDELQAKGIRIADLQIVGDRVFLQGEVDL